jgi:hypothetical protein
MPGLRLSVIAALMLSPAATALAQSYPPPVQAELRDTVESCKPQKPTFPKGFLTRKDVNGDGIPDFILDYSGVACGNDAPLNCGSHGCSIEVFASRPNGSFAKVFDIVAFGVTPRHVKGRPALVLTAVGCAPATTCVALWNGRDFKLSRRR